MPPRYCEGKCKQRHNAGKKTFDNDYDYGKIQSQYIMFVRIPFCHAVFKAAHIELLAIVEYDTCTAVNASAGRLETTHAHR